MYIPKIKKFIASTTGRLAGSYLVIIMLMSVGFSIVFYNTSSHALGRQVPPPETYTFQRFDGSTAIGIGGVNTGGLPGQKVTRNIDDFFQERIAEGRTELIRRLIMLNVLTLVTGGILSYYLARRTLEPIEANMEAQAQFVSDASHELRTPLTALQTTNEVALRRPKISTDEAKKILKDNVEEVVKLKDLTDGLLRLAKQDTHTLRGVPVSLQAVAADALNTIVSAAQAKEITVHDTVPAVKVWGEQPALVQALGILLDNAVKYSPAKTAITVEGGQHGKYGYMRVRDTGGGIAPADMPHIFDRFYRADQSRSKQKVEGYGIGLALAKKIVEQHNGEISADSIGGKGAAFTIHIPLA
jgi:signal transduction histidine kinase